MNMFEVLFSDFDIEYKIWFVRITIQNWFGDYLFPSIEKCGQAIIADQHFWMTGFFVSMLFFISSGAKDVTTA